MTGPPAPLRVAVVGTGVWGAQHARVFSTRPDATLVGVVGRDPERTEARAAAYGTRAYTDVGAMIEAERPDLVTVCLPNEAHFEPTLDLVRRGVPLLVEKPLVFDSGEAAVLIDEAEERDLFFAINFNHRYAEAVQRAKRAIDEGRLGEIVFATWRFGGEPNFGTHPHANLIETQCHGLDMLEHLVGPIASVAAQMTDKVHPGTYTTLAVALEFATGAVGTMLGSYDSSYAYPGAQHIEVNGTLGRALVEDTVARLTISRAGNEVHEVWQAGYFNDVGRDFHATFDRHVDAVLDALRTGGQPPVHARAGQRAVDLATAVIHAFESGARVAT
ncbi:MAG: Gfo/Idh/MocA family protein [Nocardioides sp.]